jgi:drug/metabolite transporter (DMT)-like permease
MESLLIPTVEPVLNPIWTMLFIGEVPGPLALCGGAVIIGAVVARGVAPLLRPSARMQGEAE